MTARLIYSKRWQIEGLESYVASDCTISDSVVGAQNRTSRATVRFRTRVVRTQKGCDGLPSHQHSWQTECLRAQSSPPSIPSRSFTILLHCQLPVRSMHPSQRVGSGGRAVQRLDAQWLRGRTSDPVQCRRRHRLTCRFHAHAGCPRQWFGASGSACTVASPSDVTGCPAAGVRRPSRVCASQREILGTA